jgi:NAD kinase
MYEKIVIVTRKTRLAELTERFNTRAQAKFYIEHSGGDFAEYEREDIAYQRAREQLSRALDFGVKVQSIDRGFLPNFVFGAGDLIIAVGQDGLVANTAKYAGNQPIIGVNPDRNAYDGILVPIAPDEARHYALMVMDDKAQVVPITLAEARLNDGQRLLAFNDLFIGARSHVSARYRIAYGGQSEQHSSSGIIVSTGAGSTGWLSSIFNMVSSVNAFFGEKPSPGVKLEWRAEQLVFVVREPFVSKHSAAQIGAGMVSAARELTIESRMPSGGTIFSDGIESDFLEFNAGMIATIGVANQKAQLVMPVVRETRHSQSRPPITKAAPLAKAAEIARAEAKAKAVAMTRR